jgi:predicted DNA-binding transcriptional regulator YafY
MSFRPIPRSKTPRVGRPTGRFTQHRRIDLLREKLEAHTAGLSLNELALMLRITTRSVRRYLRELSLVTEIESIAARPGAAHLWRIKPSERGRNVALRRTQAYGILAARRVFDVLKGSALFDEIDVVLSEIEQVARRPAGRLAPRGEPKTDGVLEDRFAYVPPAARAYPNRADDVDEAFRAVSEQRALAFRYREEREDRGEAREPREGREAREGRSGRLLVHPYALVLHGGAIMCIAHDLGAGAVRVFAFHRMSELEASEADRFELPPDFALASWLHGDFGIASAARSLRVLVEFDARLAEGVRARRVHPTQKLAVATDGRVRASFSVPDCPEIHDRVKAWLLGFGAGAHLLEPRELADEIARELRRAAARYPA